LSKDEVLFSCSYSNVSFLSKCIVNIENQTGVGKTHIIYIRVNWRIFLLTSPFISKMDAAILFAFS